MTKSAKGKIARGHAAKGKRTQPAKNANNDDNNDPIKNVLASLVHDQLQNLIQPSNPPPSQSQPRVRLPSSKRPMSESDSEDDDCVDTGGENGASSSNHCANNNANNNNTGPSSKGRKQSTTQPNNPEHSTQVVLLDGVHENLKTNPTKFLKALRQIKPNLEIKKVRKTASGSMLIHPKEPKDCNSLLKADAFVPNSILGPNVTARLPKAQTITHQVIIKPLDVEVTEDEVKEMLDRQELPYVGVKRIFSREKDAPTKMMRLFLKDDGKKKHLLKNGLFLDQMHFKCVPAKEDVEKKLAFQCWNCQIWNDHKTFECKNETKCVICAGNHRKTECQKQKTEASCSNCKGSHPAWSTDCPAYKAEIEKKKSFSNATSESVKTPSLLTETLKPIIHSLLESLKKQIAVVVAEVVSKALLEHIFYEGESRKTNGATYLGATARVNSIVKMSTQAVNGCPFHESDESTVDKTTVQSEVMRRLQSFMSNGNQSQSTPTQKGTPSSK